MKFARIATPARPLQLAELAVAACAFAAAGATVAPALGDGGAQAQTPPRVAADVAKVLESYLVGPQAASELGCRVKWQTYAAVPEGGSLKFLDSSPDAVLAVNKWDLGRPKSAEANPGQSPMSAFTRHLRDVTALEMTAAEVDEAERLAADWLDTHM